MTRAQIRAFVVACCLGFGLLVYIVVSCIAWPIMLLLSLGPRGSFALRWAWILAGWMSAWGHTLTDD